MSHREVGEVVGALVGAHEIGGDRRVDGQTVERQPRGGEREQFVAVHTVGGAQNVLTRARRIWCSSAAASKRL